MRFEFRNKTFVEKSDKILRLAYLVVVVAHGEVAEHADHQVQQVPQVLMHLVLADAHPQQVCGDVPQLQRDALRAEDTLQKKPRSTNEKHPDGGWIRTRDLHTLEQMKVTTSRGSYDGKVTNT